MPFGGLLSLGTAAISGGSALAGLFGGSPASNVPTPQINTYNYQDMGGADQNAYSGIGGLSQYNVPGQLLPQYMQLAQSGVNNPYASLYQGGAGVAGQQGVGSGANAYGAGGSVMGSSLSTLPDVQALMTLGFDPQNAMYSQALQQTTDQTQAAMAQSGVAGTPYGAGVLGNTLGQFNTNWQNSQLQRAATGAGAAGSLLGQAGAGLTTGGNLQAGAAGQTLAGYGDPYNTFQGINTNALNTLSQAGQFGQSGAQIPQSQISDYLQYLSQGSGAMAQGNQASLGLGQFQLNQANSGFAQNQIYGNQLGQALSGVSKYYTGTGAGGTSAGGTG